MGSRTARDDDMNYRNAYKHYQSSSLSLMKPIFKSLSMHVPLLVLFLYLACLGNHLFFMPSHTSHGNTSHMVHTTQRSFKSSLPVSNNRNIQSRMKWAIATLVTLSAGKRNDRNSITYTHQAVLLAKQLSERYPGVPLLAIISTTVDLSFESDDVALLMSAGYQVMSRKSIVPPYVINVRESLPPVYHDQYMKFWLWNETAYDHIVYIDSDTFFTNTALVDFQAFFKYVREDSVVACPTYWSQVGVDHTPITWNGGFFILKPDRNRFSHLMDSPELPTHFLTHYGQGKQWFDTSEMGAFMRDFPVFTHPSPLSEYCADIQSCCVSKACETLFDMPALRGVMVHGLKPEGQVSDSQPLSSIFDFQRLQVFREWGYNPDCLLSQFYEPLIQLYLHYNLIPGNPVVRVPLSG